MKKTLLILTILLVLTACAKPVTEILLPEEPVKNTTEEKNITAEEPAKNITIEEKQEEPVNNETVEEKNETIQKVETMAKKVHAKHILVKTEEEANAILYDLNHGKEFDDLAKEQSLCPSGKKGGDLGWFGKGMMVKEFEDAAFSLNKDELSKPVKTQFGWHIIKVIEKE